MRLARLGTVVVVPAVILGLSKLHAAVIATNPYDFTSSPRLAWAVLFTVALLVGTYTAGVPSLVDGPRTAVLASIVAVGIGTLTISAFQLVAGDALLPRFVVFGSALVLGPVLALLGLADVSSRRRIAQRDRVLFVGGNTEGEQLAQDLRLAPERSATLVGSVRVEELLSGRLEGGLAERVEAADANLVVLDLSAQGEGAVVSQAALVHEGGVRIRTLSLFYEQWLAKLPVSELERVSLLFDVGELHRARYARVKRIIDLAAGCIGVLVLTFMAPLVWVGNQVGNRGPLIFRQERVGRGGTTFVILKFRTMAVGNDEESWTQRHDPRVTRFGAVLRRWHIDELPQMVNVLRGDLSLVGPRPEQPQYVAELTEKLPFYRVRHLVRPGLTGWAQVKYGYAGDERDALEKLQYEFFYLRRQGLLLDARIVGRTARSVLWAGGR